MYKPYEGFKDVCVSEDVGAPQKRRVVADESLVYIPGTSKEDLVIYRRKRALDYLKTQKRYVEGRAEGQWYKKTSTALMLGASILFLLGGGGSNTFSEQEIKPVDFINGVGFLGGLLIAVLVVGSFKARAAPLIGPTSERLLKVG